MKLCTLIQINQSLHLKNVNEIFVYLIQERERDNNCYEYEQTKSGVRRHAAFGISDLI
jgi:hypothetical protein